MSFSLAMLTQEVISECLSNMVLFLISCPWKRALEMGFLLVLW
ncbi:hypothetical protein SLEP1_g54526 [Rubroshorea leprosula]|uniref:Uncharacterized protein n=1 Tax=Rubroshorea leprosula TaxID=152421 RepID=A0AAV5MCP4_9ROSI|nr:hypothetical protein SLEP1_g54526 [Rubroshorea leprosula]